MRVRASQWILLAVCIVPMSPVALAQTSKGPDLGVVIESVSRTADDLHALSDGVLAASSRMAAQRNCQINRELVGLGGALRRTADALDSISPMLLQRQQVSLRELFDQNPGAVAAVRSNASQLLAFAKATGSLDSAGKALTSLDPAGSGGPSVDVVRSLTSAGQTLLDIDEQSGIGIHIRRIAETMDTVREATARYEPAMCADATRLMSQMIALTAESLGGSATELSQLEAMQLIGVSLDQLANKPSDLSDLGVAVRAYRDRLQRNAASLTRQASIFLAVTLPPAAVAAGAGTVMQESANLLIRNAGTVRAEASRMNDALSALTAGQRGATTVVMQSAGARLKLSGRQPVRVAGDALVRASGLIAAGQSAQASAILHADALQIISMARPQLNTPRLR